MDNKFFQEYEIPVGTVATISELKLVFSWRYVTLRLKIMSNHNLDYLVNNKNGNTLTVAGTTILIYQGDGKWDRRESRQ